ncbi:MAG TPA: isoleucine--tRNA ligase [Thermoplasmata archaeon]|nr:isoleucine--tRNA ligase [Thermoplasmata archaeon]
MIKQAEKAYAPLEVESQVQEFWNRAKVYAKTVAAREKGEDFYFGDGPPYTTGSIHLGQVLNKSIKDAILRYRRMRGFRVRDQPGYDMHGLPIEVQVEKTLGITNKKEIEDLGIAKFVDTCRTFALDLLNKMTDQFNALGVWMDWDRPYMTIKNEFIEAAWWTLARAYERGWIYEALRSTQWCSRDETALADAEIEYSDETDPSIYVKFPLVGRERESLLIWTTTPWTLPANLAVAAHPQFVYAKVKVGRGTTTEYIWTIESTVPSVMATGGVTSYEIVERLTGDKLLGWPYTHPLAAKVPYQSSVAGEWVHKVVASDIVEAEHTGLVHSAPGHGPEDFDLGQRLGLPVFSPVDERGRFTKEAGAYADQRVKEADATIIEDLRQADALFAATTLVHAYGHCWRCRTPILYRATVQWFLRVDAIKPKMVEEVRRVAWFPEWAGAARQMDWTQNLRDWGISRQRYWGTPLPIWRCTKCGHTTVVSSSEALRRGRGYKDGMDLHRPGIDEVLLTCPKCREDMRRVPDILDVWWDSGVAGWASLGYPGREDEFRRWWPVDWIVEGPDQTRGWFSSQLAAGVVAFDRAPYDSVLMHGWVNGPDGRQMHKSLGNYIEPETVVQKFGVDPLRLYMLYVNAPWDDKTFQEEGVRTAHRTLNILWNVLRFATTYMVLDRFDPMAMPFPALADSLRPEDQWLLSRLEGLKGTVAAEFAAYNLHRAYRAVESFILDDLSRWYVKLVRGRTWIDAPARDKLAVYHVLFEALRTLALLLAPATPFLAEAIYQRLDGRKLSVHMLDWPTSQEERRRPALEKSMGIVQELVEVVSKERQKGGRKLRWPMKLVAVRDPTPEAAAALESLRGIFLDQANAKDVAVLRPAEEFPGMSLVLRPDAAAIGKAYRVLQPKIVKLLEARSADEVARALEKGPLTVGVEGQVVTIQPSMVRFEKAMPADVVRVATPHGELFLDLRVTPELQAEAYAREIIRRVQQMRKDLDLEVDDFIVTVAKTDRSLAAMLEPQRDLIARETRSRRLDVADKPLQSEYVVEWNDVDGHSVTIGVTPLHMSEALREFTQIPGITIPKALSLFDAGYKSLAAVRAATKQELSKVEGLEPADVVRLLDALAAKKEPPGTCPTCGASVARGARRCPRCGEAISPAMPCPRCKASIPAGSERCPVCGFVVATGPTPALSRVECVACRELIPAGSTTCPSCGASQTAPAPAAPEPGPEDAPALLKESSTYLVKEAAPAEAYSLFQIAQKAGKRGMVITRAFPQKIRERFGVADLPILWLSNVGKEDTVRPKDLEKLSLAVEQFLAREKGIILLDAIEYLVTNNNFLTVLRLVQSIRDQVAINHAILLLTVSPSSLDPHQMTLLEREVDQVIVGATPDESDGTG